MNQEEIDLIYDYLHENYEYKDGYLINKKSNKEIYGSLDNSSKKLLFRAKLRINNKTYSWSYGHYIYLYHFKIKPKYLIHINKNPADNRIENLKISSKSQSMIESNIKVKNKNGLKGVVKDKKRFAARLWIGNTYKYLGWFNTPEEAHALWVKEREKYKS